MAFLNKLHLFQVSRPSKLLTSGKRAQKTKDRINAETVSDFRRNLLNLSKIIEDIG